MRDEYFKEAMGIKEVPSAETLRQRMDAHADKFRRLVESCAVEAGKRSGAPVSGLDTGHLPLDIDVFPNPPRQALHAAVRETLPGVQGICAGI